MSSTTAASASLVYYPERPRRFAPLNPAKQKDDDAPKLKGIIFDVDGTLCLPQNYMFKEMRSALDIPKSTDILDHISSLSDSPDSSDDNSSSPQSRAQETIRNIERRAMTSQRPQPGLVELMTYLGSRGVKKALCTRNFPAPVDHLLSKYLPDEKFEGIITRETPGVAPKPSPEGLWKIVKDWDFEAYRIGHNLNWSTSHDPLNIARYVLGNEIIMVGDSIDDMAAGYRAGAATVLLLNEENQYLAEHEYTDLSIRRLDDLVKILENGFVGENAVEQANEEQQLRVEMQKLRVEERKLKVKEQKLRVEEQKLVVEEQKLRVEEPNGLNDPFGGRHASGKR